MLKEDVADVNSEVQNLKAFSDQLISERSLTEEYRSRIAQDTDKSTQRMDNIHNRVNDINGR